MYSELLFIQCYQQGHWNHTWTLAVEEHFYLALPILLLWLARRKPEARDPFRPVLYLVAATSIICLAARLINFWVREEMTFLTHAFPTHLRIDSLFFGVAIAYAYHFHADWFRRTFARRRYAMIGAGSLLVGITAYFTTPDGAFIYTWGFTQLYVGFAAVVVGVLCCEIPRNRLTGAVATLGTFSYSIYLWHMATIYYAVPYLKEAGYSWHVRVLIYFVSAFVVGITMAKLVELPTLRLRDRFVPSRAIPLVTLIFQYQRFGRLSATRGLTLGFPADRRADARYTAACSRMRHHAQPAQSKRRPLRTAGRIIRSLLVLYLVVVLMFMFLETMLVYPIPPLARGDWHPAGLDFEDVHFTSADGTKLHGWFVERPDARRAILYCHGNGENVGMNADVVGQLSQALDASVFIFDYRGYGHSEGSPTEAGCIADGLAAQRWLAARIGQQTSDVIVMGRSIGGAIATAVAAEQGARALVLVNSFSRMVDVAANHYPWLPVRLVMKNRYDSVARMRKYDGPVFQSHGTADWIVPIHFGRELFAAAPHAQKQFVEYEGLGHNDPEPHSYYTKLETFLDDVERDNSLKAGNVAK